MADLLGNGLSSYLALWAIVLFNGGIWLFMKRLRLAPGERNSGTIVGYVERRQPKPRAKPMLMPRVRYTSLQHGQQEFVSRMSADAQRLPIGTQVPVAHSAADPTIAEIATFGRLWLAPLVFWILAAALLVAAAKQMLTNT